MSSSNSFPVVQDDAEEEMSEGSRKDGEGSFNFKNWLQSSLKDHERNESKLAEKGDMLKNGEEGFLRVLRDVSEDYGKKRLFVCCDGTWLNASGTVAPLSNVAKLARSVNREGDDPFGFETIGGVPQLVYYSSGVGTRSSLGMDSSIAAATGKGISHAIRDAYCFLSNNYNGISNKDEIILVGFSRGAFTVRCLAEFISRVGLLRRKALPFLPVFFEDWVNGDNESLDQRLRNTTGTEEKLGLFYDDLKIKVLAEWDPVDTLGIPHVYESGLQRCMEAQIVPKKVEHAFLALSLGEKRLSYWPTVWKKKWTDSETIEVSQCAFLGDHGDVGGGHPDPGLSTISLLWMVSKIQSACFAEFQVGALLQFNTPILDTYFRLNPFSKRRLKGFRERRLRVRNLANTEGIIHRPSFWWFLPHYLTFHWLNGRRGPIIHELAVENEAKEKAKDKAKDEANDEPKHETTGCDLEAHITVRLLKEKRNVSLSPLVDVPEQLRGNDHRYKWTLNGNPRLFIYEQPLDPKEEELLKGWEKEAKTWQSPGFQQGNNEEYGGHNGRDEWKGVIQDGVWGFEEGGKFDESLIKEICKEICDDVQVAL